MTVPAVAQESINTVEQATQLTNKTCPVTTDEAVDPQQWIDYQGKRVYFCCQMCKRKFERNPETYLPNLPQFADAAMDTHGEHDHTAIAEAGPHTDALQQRDENSEEAAEHDHSAHKNGSDQGGLAKLISWLGKSHPPSVHFPIALLISAAVAELLLMVTGRSLFESAARFCVWLGSISTLGAVTLGWFFAGFRLSDPDWIMTVHRWLGTGVGFLAILILALCIAADRPGVQQKRWKLWYRLTLFTGAVAVAANGFFGGAMIYGLNHYAW
ncbi:YHS domain-containing protein [bacterium AH-315-I18]|nr:YHS domain-containing protein [bacterium AH-315-I18]